ncbi:MAG: phosphoribosyl-ATP diphosphatase [Parasphingorhabdus sp.]|nr:phosphoribosyl-ATP diphosphatase [Parasphingorhabdus sp.]
MSDTLSQLERVIAKRRDADPATSYVAALYAGGRARMARKLGEEAVETVVAAMADDQAAVVAESADLLFHLLVLLSDFGLTLEDVTAELMRREGLSGHAEKAARPKEIGMG